jgi:hypothetical protein
MRNRRTPYLHKFHVIHPMKLIATQDYNVLNSFVIVIILNKYRRTLCNSATRMSEWSSINKKISTTSSIQINFLIESAVPWNHPAGSSGICVAANTCMLEQLVFQLITCPELRINNLPHSMEH